MRKADMSARQLADRTLLVDRLSGAGWHGTVFNENFDKGLDTTTEASMEYANAKVALRVDMKLEDDPRVVLHIDAPDGRTLGLVFKCMDHLEELLAALIARQDLLSRQTLKESTDALLVACPRMFKISEAGDGLIPVVSRKSE